MKQRLRYILPLLALLTLWAVSVLFAGGLVLGVAGVFLYPSLQELTMVVSSSLESRTNARKSRTEENFQARQHAARAARNNRKQVRRSHEATLA